MILKTENCEWQALMDGPYDRWQKHNEKNRKIDQSDHIQSWGVRDMLIHACNTKAERAACIFGKLNQQIENGGVTQWVDNGYAYSCIDWLPEYLPATGPAGQKIWGLLSSFLEDYMDESTGELERFDEDGDEWEDCMNCSDRISNEFYDLQDKWHPEVYAYLEKLSESE